MRSRISAAPPSSYGLRSGRRSGGHSHPSKLRPGEARQCSLDASNPPFWKWFVGGRLNACYNCVDRHLDRYRNKAALLFVPEPESETAQAVTYQELYVRVN
jgi:hypothetical protein